MKMFIRVLLFVIIAGIVQHLFIAYVPNLVFEIAKYSKHQPVNTVIHAPKTDAKLRQVVLPNPDFIYSACFYDVSRNDLLITYQFADTTQYCSLAFYGDNMQPYYVRNNLQGFNASDTLRLSAVNREQRTLRATTKQGVILMRVLVTNKGQTETARKLQKSFKVSPIPQSD